MIVNHCPKISYTEWKIVFFLFLKSIQINKTLTTRYHLTIARVCPSNVTVYGMFRVKVISVKEGKEEILA